MRTSEKQDASYKSTHPAIGEVTLSHSTGSGAKLFGLLRCTVFLYKPLRNRKKKLWFFFCCSGSTVPGVLLCSAYGFLLICCERRGSVEAGFFCSALLYSAVKPYAILTVSHKILRASVITNFMEAVAYQLCDFPAGSNKRSQVPVKRVGMKPSLSGSILKRFPSLFPSLPGVVQGHEAEAFSVWKLLSRHGREGGKEQAEMVPGGFLCSPPPCFLLFDGTWGS